MGKSILEKLPPLEEVERAISLRQREARLLRAIRDALRRRRAQEEAASVGRDMRQQGAGGVR